MSKSQDQVCQEQEYKALFYQYFEKLRNFIYCRYGTMTIAEDIAQESFITLWDNCHKVTLKTAKSYLFSVAKNKSLNVIRDTKIALKYIPSTTDHQTHISPEFLMEEKEFMETLTAAIENLKPKQREVFMLHRVEKYTYKEIAVLLDISQKAVEKRMHLAMRTLKENIGNFKI